VETLAQMNEVQKNTLLEMEQETQIFKENRPRILEEIEDKLFSLKAAVVQEQHEKRERLDRQQQEIDKQIETLNDNLFKEINAR